MSERDELFEIVMRDPISSGGDAVWTNDLLEAFEQRVKREHAHELAEKIRDVCHDAYDPGEPGVCQLSGWTAARVIDPEVQS